MRKVQKNKGPNLVRNVKLLISKKKVKNSKICWPFENLYANYSSKIKKTPTPGTKRRRRERKRDKKILKEYHEEMRVIGEDPDAIYDGGRRRGTRKNKRANRKTRAKK
jgi:hypothetical protein